MKTKRFDIFGIKINNTTMNEVINTIKNLVQRKGSQYICVSNVHTVVDSYRNKNLKEITNRSNLSIPDGMPLVWIGRLKGNKIERTSGPDLMEKIFELSDSDLTSEKKQITHYFYGSTNETLSILNSRLKSKYPNLKIVGMYSPPFRELSHWESENILSDINQVKPDIIWVGLGAPKQEKWMYDNVNKIENSVLVGVGAAFNFHAGTVKRAPKVLQMLGLEWMFRLIQEPRRLFKRYLITNSLFVYYLLKHEVLKLK